MSEEFNVLVSSAGRRVALLNILRRTLLDMKLRGKVMATDMVPLSSAFQTADEAFLVPPCSSPEFVPTMLEICRDRGVRFLVPTIDPELLVYAEHQNSFSEIGTTVAISAPETVAIGWDKQKAHAWLTDEGFPTVRQAAAEELNAQLDGWAFPLLVKPRTGSASIGVSAVRDQIHLEVATRGGDFIVEAIAPGDEYTIDLLANRAGACVCAVPRRRIEVRAGESSKGMTVRLGDLEELARRLCRMLPGAFGPLNFQVFVDQGSGALNVIEINPRFAGGFPLSWHAGAKFPQWMIEEILGLPSSASQSAWREGIVMLRWDEAVFVDAEQVGL